MFPGSFSAGWKRVDEGGKSFGSVSGFLVTFLLGLAILMGDDPASDSFDLP